MRTGRRVLVALAVAMAATTAPVWGQTGLDGRPVTPLDGDAVATVLLFTTVDCPISDRYTPEVRRIADRYASRGVRLWVVYANAGEREAAARAHAEAFAHGLPVVMDPTAALADRGAAAVTPEAALFDRRGRLVYHGRIDDRYVDFGVDRPVPTTHDLDDAIAAVLAGRTPPRATAPAIGCAIVRRQP